MGEAQQGRQDWYSGKEIADMFLGMKEDIAGLRVEMRETKTLIRDYNGLRKRIDKCEERLDKGEGQSQGEEKQVQKTDSRIHFSWEKLSYLVGLAGIAVAIAALFIR